MNSMEFLVFGLLAAPLTASLLCLYIDQKGRALNAVVILFALLTIYFAVETAWISTTTKQLSVGVDWFTLGNQIIRLSFDFDRNTLSLAVLVSMISFLIQLFSIGFLTNDSHQPRYFATVNLFTFSMLGLTLSGNLFQLFIFWELVGLCSYLLIGYYRHKPEAAAASSKSFIINKIGDTGFLIALMILWVTNGSFEIQDLATSHFITDAKPVISGFILLAVFSKSAQFPFHKWLIDAMEGPTPVSAMIHSATMVAAGVFLMARVQFLFVPETLLAAALVGGFTTIIGGVNALRENDLKKVLAWSTLSQLGLMVMVAGGSGFASSFIHLISHAIFKSGLFLTAGILISHYGNIRVNENLPSKINSTALKASITLLVLSLMGIPLSTGFLSKEIMLGQINSTPVLIVFFLTNLLTVLYSVRLLTFLITKTETTSATPWKQDPIMLMPVVVLAAASLWIFYSFSPFFIPWVSELWALEAPSLTIASFSVIWILSCTGIAFYLVRKERLNQLSASIPFVPFDRWLDISITRPVISLAEFSNVIDRQILDRGIRVLVYAKFSFALLIGWLDRVMVDGLVQGCWWLILFFGNLVRKLVAGKIQDYLWWTILAIIILLIWAM